MGEVWDLAEVRAWLASERYVGGKNPKPLEPGE
jgi:hypothetical protein